jgi:antitoxin FitA
MAHLVVRNLEDRVKAGLLRRAQRNRRSLEEEVKTILRAAVEIDEPAPPLLGTRISKRFEGIGLERPIPELRGKRLRG